MSIEDRVMTDMKAAMRAKSVDELRALRNIRAAFISKKKEDGAETLSDDDAIAILRKLSKQLNESIEAFDAGGRDDLATAERAEFVVVDAFLPKLADEATTAQWVDDAIAKTGAKTASDMGKVMGALMKAHKGDMDGGLANKLVRAKLS